MRPLGETVGERLKIFWRERQPILAVEEQQQV